MDYQIVWTKSAQEDLKQIVSFIAVDNPSAAERFGVAFIDQVEQIAQFPWSGRRVPEKKTERLRELIYAPYRIIYEISGNQSIIYIVRIWHAARGQPQRVTYS